MFVALEAGGQLVGWRPTVFDYLLVAESLDRLALFLGLGDGDADAAGFGGDEQFPRQSV
jgi:hypothetical protein